MSIETFRPLPGVEVVAHTPSKIDWLLYHDDAIRIHKSRYPDADDLEENLAAIFTNPRNIVALAFNRLGLLGYGYAYPNPRNGIPNSAEVMYVVDRAQENPAISLGIVQNLEARLNTRYNAMVIKVPRTDTRTLMRHYKGRIQLESDRSPQLHRVIIGLQGRPARTRR